MENPIVQWLINLGIGGIVLAVVAGIAKVWPKEKAIALANKIGDIIGTAITTFGNSRLGKKIWNKVEEGPITTALAFVIALCVRIGSKMVYDNNINVELKEKEKEQEQEKPIPEETKII